MLKFLIADFNKYIQSGDILPHSDEGRRLSIKNTKPKDMNEAQVRQSFILPLIETLGWNKQNPLEVIAEERASGGFLDIRLSTNGKTHFVIEIKRPSVNLDISSSSGKSAAYQGIGYARSFSENPITIVTNFERLNIYHSYGMARESEVNSNLLATFLWKDFDSGEAVKILKNITKSSCENVHAKLFFESLIKNKEVIKRSKPLNQKILEDFEKWRLSLGQDLFTHGLIDPSTLNILVQRILDKVILIRNLQDRRADASGLSNLKNLVGEKNIGKKLGEVIFPHFEKSISEEFFKQNELERKFLPTIADDILKNIILKTYGEDEKGVVQDIYDFAIIPVELLGYAYEQYLGKVFVIEKKPKQKDKLKLDFKPELKKSGGVCYTPVFVVDYIIHNIFNGLGIEDRGESIKKLKEFKILDPSCGSGSFLIRLFGQLIKSAYTKPNKKSELSEAPDLKQKIILLQNCVYGVDIDERAVEITKLSLILKLLEGEQQLSMITKGLVPDLSKNIRTGNSLISPSDLDQSFNVEEKKEMRPLDWKRFLTDVSCSTGFSAIIGNPPYVRNQHFIEAYPQQAKILQKRYTSFSEGNADIYLPFIERAFEILRPDGVLSYIMPHRFWANDYGKQIRALISSSYKISEVLNFRAEQVFDGPTTYTTIMTFTNTKPTRGYSFSYIEGKPEIGAEVLTKLAIDSKVRGSSSDEIICDMLKSEILKESDWLLAPNRIRTSILALEKKGTKLEEFISDKGIYQGIITGGDEDYFIPVEDWKNELNKFLVKMLKGSRDMKAFSAPEFSNLLIYPYILEGTECQLASLTEIKKVSPELYKVITERETTLRKRNSLKTKAQREEDLKKNKSKFETDEEGNLIWHYLEDDYYKYARNQALNAPKLSKVLVPSLFRRPCFIPDYKGEYITPGSGSGGGGGYIFTLKDKYVPETFVLIGLLSNDVLHSWFERRGDLYREYYVGVDKKILNTAPVLYNSLSKEAKKRISTYVSDLFECNDEKDIFYQETLNSLTAEVESLLTEGK